MRCFYCICFITLLAFCNRAEAQMENVQTHNFLNRPEPFFVDAIAFAQPDSVGMRSRLDVFVKIPYDIIQFIKNEESYSAHYTLTAIFTTETGERIKEDSWEQAITQNSFDGTVAKNMSDLTQRNLYLPPGPVIMEIIFEDGESKKEYRITKRIEVRKFDKNLFSMSDIMLVSKASETGGKKMITPNVSSNVGGLPEGFYLFYEVYNPFLEQKMNLRYEVKSSKGTTVFTRNQLETLKQGKNSFITKLSQTVFDIGSYALAVSLFHTDDTAYTNSAASSSRPFIIEWLSAGAPVSINDLDAAIEQLKWFARSDDMDYLKEAKDPTEKRKRFEDFWERNNPTPGSKSNPKMIEYYNRVAYADTHFKHYIEGWKTDRGMVYIINGPPSYVERHPLDAETKPYEIWEYYDINRQYVFTDDTGFGDYRLLYPFWDDRTRIR